MQTTAFEDGADGFLRELLVIVAGDTTGDDDLGLAFLDTEASESGEGAEP